MKQATKLDWQLFPIPENQAVLKINRVFSRSQMDRIRHGVIPRYMDERWFIYFEDNALYLHRSWTGYYVFIVSLIEIENDAWHISHCLVSRDKEQYGEMKWSRRYLNNDGFLTVEWSAWEDKFEHRMHLETKQVVGELYQSFRSFVESDRYEPLRYEALTIGEELLLELGGQYSSEQISSHIKTLDADEARKLIDSIFDRSYRRHGVNKPDDTWPESLDELSQPITISKILLLYVGTYSNKL